MWIYFVAAFVCLWIYEYVTRKTKLEVDGRHVFITGGSSGIGFSVAKLIVSEGGKVTLIARDLKKLENAKAELVTLSKEEAVNIQSVDISGSEDVLKASVKEAERIHGPIYMLVNCAGFAYPSEYDEVERFRVQGMFNVNFFGSFYLAQIVGKNMKENGIRGKIIFVSSLSGLFGFYGFAAYAASKAAVNKAAEAIHQELRPYGISVTVGLPPDTDTPGYAEEQKTKPAECHNISEGAGMFTPDEVAKFLLRDAMNNKFYSAIGLNGFMLSCLCSDMTPIISFYDLACEVVFGGLFRFVAAIYLYMCGRMIQAENRKKMALKK